MAFQRLKLRKTRDWLDYATLTFFADPNNPGQISEWSFTDFASTPISDSAAPTPECSTLLAVGIGLCSLGWMKRRKGERLSPFGASPRHLI
jgi:hypothetical protein